MYKITFTDKTVNEFPDFPIYEINHSRRVYNSGDYIDNGVSKEDLDRHVGYRPGTALFINGICIKCGYLSEERCNKIALDIQGYKIKMKTVTAPYA